MRVLVTGAGGQLGRDAMNELVRRGHEAIGSGRGDSCGGPPTAEIPYVRMDVTDAALVKRTVGDLKPDAVLHCAAWTAVDAAEDNERLCRSVNAEGTRNLAEACASAGAKMLYVSTDYVFDGSGREAWRPDCRDCRPLNVYGRTKLEGELAVASLLERYFIVRTSWLFGLKGSNFVRTMLRIGGEREEVRVVSDQVGAPTYSPDLARLLADMLETERYGCYHAANEGGYVSRYDFVCEIFRRAGCRAKACPVTSEEYGLSGAVRPLNSRLDTSCLAENGFAPLPDWRDALARYLGEPEMQEYLKTLSRGRKAQD